MRSFHFTRATRSLALVIGVLSLASGGCRRAVGSGVGEGDASAKPVTTPPPDAHPPDVPLVTTIILEERQGADTLTLYDVIAAPGYLKPDPRALAVGGPGVRFGVSLLDAVGDTVYRVGLASALTQDMDVAEPGGAFRHVEVVHDVIPHVIRYGGARPSRAVVLIRDASGATVATQSLSLVTATDR